MTETNNLPYYPRFILNCDDGNCMSTGDLEMFKFIKEANNNYEITRFTPGQLIQISWSNENDEPQPQIYKVEKIEIHQIKYDLDEPTYGINTNDCTGIVGKEKKWMMDIYVFLNRVEI